MSEVSEVAKLEAERLIAKELIERRQMALKLTDNHEFRKLIIEGFCRTDAARYVQESADPFLTAEQRADCLAMAQASGHFKRYIAIIIQMGAPAERTLEDLDDALAEARAEEGSI